MRDRNREEDERQEAKIDVTRNVHSDKKSV